MDPVYDIFGTMNEYLNGKTKDHISVREIYIFRTSMNEGNNSKWHFFV